MSGPEILPNATDIERLLKKPAAALNFDETRHTDAGPEISYKLPYGITVKLSGQCSQEDGLRIYSLFGGCVERWLERLSACRDEFPAERRPRLPTGHLDLLTIDQTSEPGKVRAVKKAHSIEYSGELDVIEFTPKELKTILFADLCVLYEMLVRALGPGGALITVGDDTWRATAAGNVPAFAKATFGITTVPGAPDP